jgi:hypothetical protein
MSEDHGALRANPRNNGRGLFVGRLRKWLGQGDRADSADPIKIAYRMTCRVWQLHVGGNPRAGCQTYLCTAFASLCPSGLAA